MISPVTYFLMLDKCEVAAIYNRISHLPYDFRELIAVVINQVSLPYDFIRLDGGSLVPAAEFYFFVRILQGM